MSPTFAWSTHHRSNDASAIVIAAANAAETIDKEKICDDARCLGVWDGLLADCPHSRGVSWGGGAGCVSSQDDTPGIFAEPWDYSDDMPLIPSSSTTSSVGRNDITNRMDRLILMVDTTSRERGDSVSVQLRDGLIPPRPHCRWHHPRGIGM